MLVLDIAGDNLPGNDEDFRLYTWPGEVNKCEEEIIAWLHLVLGGQCPRKEEFRSKQPCTGWLRSRGLDFDSTRGARVGVVRQDVHAFGVTERERADDTTLSELGEDVILTCETDQALSVVVLGLAIGCPSGLSNLFICCYAPVPRTSCYKRGYDIRCPRRRNNPACGPRWDRSPGRKSAGLCTPSPPRFRTCV